MDRSCKYSIKQVDLFSIRQKVPFHSHIVDPSLCVYVCVSIKPIKLENRPRDIKMHYVLG